MLSPSAFLRTLIVAALAAVLAFAPAHAQQVVTITTTTVTWTYDDAGDDDGAADSDAGSDESVIDEGAAPDAEFGVHSWADEYGREANDYPANDPVHAEYLGYYREMGLNDAKARAFYALTNSTPFDDVRYLTRDDMARFVALN
jgi:hypothetical protein